MKKLIAGVITMGLLLSVGATTVSAAGPGCGRYYVDADGDGVYDNYASGRGGRWYVDSDGDGFCDNYSSGRCGRWYTGADGVQNNKSSRAVRVQNGSGYQRGYQSVRGR